MKNRPWLKDIWQRVKNTPPKPVKTAEEVLRETLHKEFPKAMHAAIGLMQSGLLTRQEADYIIDRANVQDPAEREQALKRLASCGIV